MALLATGAGDVALIILAGFWALLVLFLCYVLVKTVAVIASTQLLIDGIREETVPLLSEVKGSVERTNRELDRVDGMLVSGGAIVARVEEIPWLVEQATSSALMKINSIGPGLRKAASKVSGQAKGSAGLLGS